MKIEVRLHASLSGKQPDPPWIDLPEGTVLKDAFAFLGVADASTVVAMLDGGPAWPDTPLRDGCRLDLMPIVDGG